MLRFLTAGESHGQALVAILEGMVANLPIAEGDINKELQRRQGGYGRGGRMKIEKDRARILSGVRFGKTLGSPITLIIENLDWSNWTKIMAVEPGKSAEAVTRARPGHADLAGITKYNQTDIRNILERASARETAARVAICSIAKRLLFEFGIHITSRIAHVGGETNSEKIKTLIDQTREAGDTLGGVFEVKIENVPVGLGSYAHYDRRLDGKLAQAFMSIPAVKGVEIGLGFETARLFGSKVHDEIFVENGKYVRKTNNAGGLEGGITNGEPVIIKAAMKPISTLLKPLHSVDIAAKQPAEAHVERSDVSAVEAAAVVGEAAAAFEIANAFLEKFGGDSLEEIKNRLTASQK